MMMMKLKLKNPVVQFKGPRYETRTTYIYICMNRAE